MLVSRQSSTLSTSSKETITTSTAHTATMFILAALNKILADKYGQEARRPGGQEGDQVINTRQ